MENSAVDVAVKIFYSPATNGQASESIANGVIQIEKFAKEYSSQQNSQLIKEVKELKEEIEGTGKEILKQQFEIIEGGLRTEVVRVIWIKMMFTKLGVDIEQKIDF